MKKFNSVVLALALAFGATQAMAWGHNDFGKVEGQAEAGSTASAGSESSSGAWGNSFSSNGTVAGAGNVSAAGSNAVATPYSVNGVTYSGTLGASTSTSFSQKSGWGATGSTGGGASQEGYATGTFSGGFRNRW
jgi:hypothetical protein